MVVDVEGSPEARVAEWREDYGLLLVDRPVPPLDSLAESLFVESTFILIAGVINYLITNCELLYNKRSPNCDLRELA
jgi:hypothetical protein